MEWLKKNLNGWVKVLVVIGAGLWGLAELHATQKQVVAALDGKTDKAVFAESMSRLNRELDQIHRQLDRIEENTRQE